VRVHNWRIMVFPSNIQDPFSITEWALSLVLKKKKKTLLCYHDILKAIILPHLEGNRVGRMVGHPITKEEPHQSPILFWCTLINNIILDLQNSFSLLSWKRGYLSSGFLSLKLSLYQPMRCWVELVVFNVVVAISFFLWFWFRVRFGVIGRLSDV
jgi:hypothetical protein